MSNDRFYVRRPTGKVFGPFDRNAIQMMLKSGKLGGDADVSTDKVSWEPVTAIPDFAEYATGGASGNNPKATMMGMGVDRAAPDLPMAKTQADLPAPRGAGAELPAPRGAGAELPAPRGGGAELPAPRSGPPALPVPKGAGPGLPVPKSSGPGLPVPKPSGGAGLPVSKTDPLDDDADLPTAVHTPAMSNDIFGGGGGGGDDIFGGGGGAPADDDIFGGGAGESDDIFSGVGGAAVDDDLFGGDAAAPPDDDLFGGGGGAAAAADDDLFGGGGDDDDLFGSPAGSGDDDLFGAPATTQDPGDDLFGDAAPSGGDDDLFGSPVGGPGADTGGGGDDDLFGDDGGADDLFGRDDSEANDDLFQAPTTTDDDFLGGDAGFSFLDDEPEPDADEWGDDMLDRPVSEGSEAGFGKATSEGWGDDLLELEPRPKPRPTSQGPELDEHDPFRPASSGLKQEPKKKKVPPTGKKKGKGKKKAKEKAPSKVMLIALPILVLVVLGGGYVLVSSFLDGDGTGPKLIAQKGVAVVSVDVFRSDNYADYAKLADAATTGTVAEADEPAFLLGQSLMLARYPNAEHEKNATEYAKKMESAKDGLGAVARGAWEARIGAADAARAYVEGPANTDGDVGFFANVVMAIGDVKAMEAELERFQSEQDAKPAPKEEKAPEPTDAPDAGAEQGDAGAAPAPGPAPQPEKKKLVLRKTSAERPKFDNLAGRARKALDRAAKLDPNSPMPGYWRGRVALVAGEKDKATKAFEEVVEKNPTHVASHVRLGVLRYDGGDLNRAIELLEKVSGEFAAQASNSEKAEALHYAGLVHVARRNSDLAIESFTKAISIDASRSDTLRALAEEYESAQKYKEALAFFTTNQNLAQRNDPEVLLGIVRSHIGLEQWNRAIATLEEGQRKFPEDAQFPYYLGQTYLRRGAFFDAQKPLERAVEIDPSLLSANATLAQLAWRMDKDIPKGESYIARVVAYPEKIDAEVASAVAEYYYLSGRRDTAEQWYREALSRSPNHWDSRLALSKLLLEESRDDEAKELLERAREEGVQDVRLSAYLADAYRQSGDFDRAVDEINKVIEAFPKNHEYVFIRGRIHFDRGNFETAQADFQKAYDLNPRFHDAYFYVGRTAFERQDFSTAQTIFRHVLDYKPDRGDYRFYMARTLEADNRDTQALDEYRKATAVDPAYGIENPMVYVYRGRLLSRLGYSKEGKADIARALELAPDDVEALLAMGESEFRDSLYTEAITHFKSALDREPNRPQAQFKLGMAYLYTENRQAAAQRLQLAVKYGYEDPEAYKRLGYLYKGLGQRAEAKNAFKKFLEEAGRNAEVPVATKKEILRQIQEL